MDTNPVRSRTRAGAQTPILPTQSENDRVPPVNAADTQLDVTVKNCANAITRKAQKMAGSGRTLIFLGHWSMIFGEMEPNPGPQRQQVHNKLHPYCSANWQCFFPRLIKVGWRFLLFIG
jgi:hypothetical protein